jgi:antitoxin HicB
MNWLLHAKTRAANGKPRSWRRAFLGAQAGRGPHTAHVSKLWRGLERPGLSARMLVMKYRVYLEPDEDGVFVVTCPALPGCVSQGRTRAEATENIREAIEGYLKSLRKHGDPLPPSILEEVIEVAGG